MKTKSKIDVFEIIKHFQKTVLTEKPSNQEMFKQIEMMRYKVRPVQGDISFLNFKNNQFIEALWSLGKLDEFFQTNLEKLKKDEKEVFLRLIDGLRYEYQHALNNSNIKPEQLSEHQSIFELEIYKEKIKRVN